MNNKTIQLHNTENLKDRNYLSIQISSTLTHHCNISQPKIMFQDVNQPLIT